MKQVKRMLPFVLVSVVILYGCPYVAKRISYNLMPLILLTPFLCFAIGIIYSYMNQMSALLPLIVMVLFIPAIFLFYTRTALSYPIFFGLSVIAGEIVGKLLKELPNP